MIAALLISGSAGADESARCRFRVVHALPQEGAVDGKLSELRERLGRAPFREWKTFKLLSEEERDLKPTEAADFALPGGRRAQILFAEHATEGGKHVVRGTLTLTGKKKETRTMFALDEGGPLLVAGHKHQGGILIYALSCARGK
jgi:hypothetical protein